MRRPIALVPLAVAAVAAVALPSARPVGAACTSWSDHARSTYERNGVSGVRGAAASGGLFHLVDSSLLTVWDPTDPSAPTTVGFESIGPGAEDIAVDGGFAYIPCWSSSTHQSDLRVVDVSSPSSPSMVGAPIPLATTGRVHDVAVGGGWAYVSDDFNGVWIVDVDPPSAPVVSGTVAGVSRAYGVSILGNLLLVAGDTNGLQVFDLTDPAAPAPVSTVPVTFARVRDVAHAGDASRVVLATGTLGTRLDVRLDVVDLSAPASPVVVGSTPAVSADSDMELAVEGTSAYVITESANLLMADVSVAASPGWTGFLQFPGHPGKAVAAMGDLVVVGEGEGQAGGDGGWQLVDVSTAPPLLDLADLADNGAKGVAVHDGYLHLADWTLEVRDPSSPGMPTLPVPSPGFVPGTAAFRDGLTVYAGSAVSYDGTLAVYPELDPANPQDYTAIATIPTLRGASEIELDGSLAYLAEHFDDTIVVYDALEIVDLSDSTAPVIVASVDLSSSFVTAQDLGLRHGYVYLPSSNGNLHVWDATVPTAPTPVDTLPGFSGGIHSIEGFGDHLAVTDGAGLRVVSVVSPASPAIVASLPIDGGTGVGLQIVGPVAYVRSLHRGIVAVDLSDPDDPVLLGNVGVAGSTGPIAADGDAVYMAGGTTLFRYGAACPLGPPVGATPVAAAVGSGLAAFPNPFRAGTRLSFRLERAGRVDLAVFDVTGRRVTSLEGRTLAAGAHAATWDGRDAGGRPVPTGVYFVRLAGPDGATAQRVVRIR